MNKLPSEPRSRFGLETLRGDLFGGATAAVVALPLALAFGVASGAGPVAGLYGAIAVGFFAAVFGGTPTQVSGPTGPMTVVMGAVIAAHANNLAEAFAIVTLGGLLQITFGVMRLGRYVTYTPYSVVSGFMTGIGLIIMFVQILPFLGLDASGGGVIGAIKALAGIDPSTIRPGVAGLAVAALALIVFWPKQLQRYFPAPLAALVFGTAAAVFIQDAPTIGSVPQGPPALLIPSISLADASQMLQAAFILALLGSIDSLLTSLIADSVTRTRHDPDRELIGQGIGNAVSGLIGGLPGAGATMRTLVNIRAGGRTRRSGAIHALTLLGMALGLGPVVERVPQAVLAAILMKVGWDIIDWPYLRRMASAPRDKFVIMLITMGLTVFVDLIMAVAVGIIMASLVNARHMAELQLKTVRQVASPDELDQLSDEERALLRAADGKVLITILQGTYSYASARELARRASPALTGARVCVFDFTNVAYVDTSAALAVQEIMTITHEKGQMIFISGLSREVAKTLDGLAALPHVRPEARFASRREAIEAAVRYATADADARKE
ncbi:SulP family inorganic anion transporter [Amphiplicatus metriothermophilus]|uniref:Sulfate permease, SulP family n=1 Tax=Amphiplicatus metriothermophilus TaxID=1519374 RepID=A0A239PIU7_9PROT|nr:SulP family inorganic anion transporter [Amphiplicatus metriothermophilus]MBB5517969.1 SulP family sulfate permease [Amphiplicatus metriothermophilus]SNT67698.1 sulfate permease, SulP family [Amphiplicatus metriothermophilus]